MYFYLLLLFLLGIFAFFDYFNIAIANKIMLFFIAIILIFISGFRYGLETDYWSYWRIFHGTSNVDVEIGYRLISNLIKLFTNNFNYFLLCISIISIGLKCKIFSKLQYPFVALLFFFLRFFLIIELNVMRQGLALSFLIIAIYCLYRNKKKESFFLMCIATTIHISSAVFILAFIVKDFRWNIKKLVVCFTICIIFRLYLLIPLVDIFSSFAGIGGTFIVKGTRYLLQSTSPSITNMLFSTLKILIPAICLYLLGLDEKNTFYFNMFIVGCMFHIILLGMNTIAYRMALIFYSTEGIVISQSIKHRNLKTIILITIIFLLDFITFYNGLDSSLTAIPYKNYWFVDPNIVIE